MAATYPVEILAARFPAKQAIARDERFTLIVRNAGARTIPNMAVTLDSFYYTSTYPKLSVQEAAGLDREHRAREGRHQPTSPDRGSQSARRRRNGLRQHLGLGALAPHASRFFIWHVTPVKAGVHTVHYTVAAGLDGKALARLAGGGLATGA